MKLDSQNNTKFPNRVIKRAYEINWNSGVAYCFVFFGVYCTNNPFDMGVPPVLNEPGTGTTYDCICSRDL